MEVSSGLAVNSFFSAARGDRTEDPDPDSHGAAVGAPRAPSGAALNDSATRFFELARGTWDRDQ